MASRQTEALHAVLAHHTDIIIILKRKNAKVSSTMAVMETRTISLVAMIARDIAVLVV